MRFLRPAAAALFVAALVGPVVVRPVVARAASNFTVSATTDEADAEVGDGACKTESGECTLRAAVAEAGKAGATVTLPKGTYVLATPLPVSRGSKLVVKGAGTASTVIDLGDGQGRLVVAGGSFTLDGLTLRGGHTADDGGGALSATDAAVILRNVSVEQNTSDAAGGAIEVGGGSITMSSVELHDNVGTTGGAVAALDAAVTVTNSKLHDNRASEGGGALYVARVTSLRIENSSFTDNAARGGGGAVYVDDTSAGLGELTITSSPFKGNAATGSGGAVYVRAGEARPFTVSRAAFTDNVAEAGGALAGAAGHLVVHASEFESNVAAAGEGGAIAAVGTIELEGSTFRKNSASGSGGAAFFAHAPDEKTSGGNTFAGNRADDGADEVSGAALKALKGAARGDHSISRLVEMAAALAAAVLVVIVILVALRWTRRTPATEN